MRIVNQIEIWDKDGNPKGSPATGEVEFTGSNGLVAESSGDGVLVRRARTGEDDPYYRLKYETVIKVGGGSLVPDYVFSGPPYYVSSVNKVFPPDGFLSLLGGACGQVGLFEDQANPGEPETEPAELSVFDMCRACVDCADYEAFYSLLDEVAAFIDTQKNYVESPPQTELKDGYGVYDQYIALVDYWNYLVFLAYTKAWVEKGAGSFYTLRTFCVNTGSSVDDVSIIISIVLHDDGSPVVQDSTVVWTYPAEHGVTYTTTDVGGATQVDITTPLVTNTELNTATGMDMTGTSSGTVVDFTVTWNNLHNGPFVTTGSFTTE